MKPVFYALPGNETLASGLADHMGAAVGSLEVHHFPDGESYVRLHTLPEGRKAVLVATLARPDEVFLPLAYAAEALRGAGASEVGLVAPYLAYMRQDKRFHEGEAVTSAAFAQLLSGVVDWLVTVDPHLHRRTSLDEIYSIPSLVLHAAPCIGDWLRSLGRDIFLVGPDSESRQWVESVATAAGAPYVVLEKVRRGDRDVEVSVPDAARWRGRTPVLVDDIISTARTMIATVAHLREADMKPAICIGVHPVFVEGAYEALKSSQVARIVSCNTIPHITNAIDLTNLIADGVRRLAGGPLLTARGV